MNNLMKMLDWMRPGQGQGRSGALAGSGIQTLPPLQFLVLGEFLADEPGGKIGVPEITGSHGQNSVLHALEDAWGLQHADKVCVRPGE